MTLKAFFLGKPGAQRELEKIAQDFKDAGSGFGVEPVCKILSEEEGRVIAGIKTELDFSDERGEEQQEICDMLLGKLRALALEHGFLPLDDEGRIIYLLPSYGFEVIFYCPARGRGDELFNLVRAVYNELGEHIEDGHVGTIQDNTGNGEYFRVQLGMQDYLDKPARTRLMLAAYFRLLLLARKKGFVALMPPEEIRKRGFAGQTP